MAPDAWDAWGGQEPIAKGGMAEADHVTTAMRWMTTLNRGAAEALHAVDPDAVTDVTGFGLAGHAAEMAEASGVAVEIDLAALPLLPGALEAAGGEPLDLHLEEDLLDEAQGGVEIGVVARKRCFPERQRQCQDQRERDRHIHVEPAAPQRTPGRPVERDA